MAGPDVPTPSDGIEAARAADGLALALADRPGPVVALRLAIPAGSRDDPQPGAAHALEHLLFRCSEGAEARRTIERVGGEVGGSTTREHLALDVVVLPEDVGLAIEALRQIARVEPRTTDIERERPVLLRELQHEADERRRIWQLQVEALFGAAHPLARPIPGDAASIAALDVDALAGVRARFTSGGACLAAVGPLPRDLGARVDGLLAAGPPAPSSPLPPPPAPGRSHEERRSGLLHIAVGWRFAGMADAALPALRLAEVILAHGSGSRLYERLRTQRRLAYRVSTVLVAYREGGHISAVTACDPHHLRQAELAIVGEMERLAARGPSWPELDAAKRQHAGMRARAFESSRRLSAFLTTAVLAGDAHGPAEERARLAAVTPDDVRRACSALVREGHATASIGRRAS